MLSMKETNKQNVLMLFMKYIWKYKKNAKKKLKNEHRSPKSKIIGVQD